MEFWLLVRFLKGNRVAGGHLVDWGAVLYPIGVWASSSAGGKSFKTRIWLRPVETISGLSLFEQTNPSFIPDSILRFVLSGRLLVFWFSFSYLDKTSTKLKLTSFPYLNIDLSLRDNSMLGGFGFCKFIGLNSFSLELSSFVSSNMHVKSFLGK